MHLSQFLIIMKARRITVLLTLFIIVAATVAVSLIMPPTYTATTSLVIDAKEADPITGQSVPVRLLPGYMATQVDIISSHNVALKVVDALNLADNPVARRQFMDDTGGKGSMREWLADMLLKYLEVDPSPEGSLVDVSYKGRDPQFSAAVANAFAQAYITTTLELKVEPAKQTSAWFQKQAGFLQGRLEQAQDKLSEFQRKHGLVGSDDRLDVENARLQQLSTQLVQAQTQAYDALSRQRQMHDAMKKGRDATSALPEIIGNNLIQSMKADLMRAQNKLSDVSESAGKNNPEYQRALTQVKNIRSRIDAEVKNVAAGISTNARIAQQRVDDLKQALDEQKQKILNLKHQNDQLSMLKKDVESQQNLLDTVMKRSGESRLESQMNQTDVAVLNPAVPPLKPSSPRLVLNTAVAGVLGFLLGIGLAFVRELRDRRVRSENDLVDVLGITVLGVIPRDTSARAPSRPKAEKAAA